MAVNGLAAMLCMEQRKTVAARRRARRDHVTHHVTHVIDDGGAAVGGARKSHVHAKTIKSPVLPYNKWESQPVTSLGCGKGTLSRPDSPLTAAHPGYPLGDGTLLLHHHAADNASALELEVHPSVRVHFAVCAVFRVCPATDSNLQS